MSSSSLTSTSTASIAVNQAPSALNGVPAASPSSSAKPESAAKPAKAPYELTPAQREKQAARAALKAQKAASIKAEGAKPLRTEEQIQKGVFERREWVRLDDEGHGGEQAGSKVTVMSWNMLAQTLVRRDLFPGSDCLKFATREQMLISELTAYECDVVCLQEVDQLPALRPHLAAYTATEGRGRNKRHGLVILSRSDRFAVVKNEVVYLDEAELRESPEGGDQEAEAGWRRAGTRETKNVGLLVALEDKRSGNGQGVIVVTTHLFWHPLYLAERTRQVAVLLRETLRFRCEGGWEAWPIVMAGDFNTQPFEPSYTLLVDPSRPLTASQKADLENSSVVHKSIANVRSTKPSPPAGKPEFVPPHSKPAALPAATTATGEGETNDDDDGEGDDKGGEGEGIMKNARLATPADGLLSVEELTAVFLAAEREAGGVPKSLYQEASVLGKGKGLEGLTLGERLTEAEQWLEIGRGEPCYTSYTPYWHLTLDYIFLLPPKTTGTYPRITAFLQPHSAETLGQGLPRTKISASDHVAVAGEIVLAA